MDVQPWPAPRAFGAKRRLRQPGHGGGRFANQRRLRHVQRVPRPLRVDAGRQGNIRTVQLLSHDRARRWYADLLKPGHLNQDFARYELHAFGWSMPRSGRHLHIYSRRTFTIDEDSWNVLLIDKYDGRGALWRFSGATQRELVQHPDVVRHDRSAPRSASRVATSQWVCVRKAKIYEPIKRSSPITRRRTARHRHALKPAVADRVSQRINLKTGTFASPFFCSLGFALAERQRQNAANGMQGEASQTATGNLRRRRRMKTTIRHAAMVAASLIAGAITMPSAYAQVNKTVMRTRGRWRKQTMTRLLLSDVALWQSHRRRRRSGATLFIPIATAKAGSAPRRPPICRC